MARQTPGQTPLTSALTPYVLGFVVGLAALAVKASTPPLSALAGTLSFLLEILMVAVWAWTGYRAKQRHGHPSWEAAGVGVAYGVLAGLGAFVRPPTVRQELALLTAHAPPHTSRAALLAVARASVTPAAHVASWVIAVAGSVVAGLVVGWIGSLFYMTKPEETRPVGAGRK